MMITKTHRRKFLLYVFFLINISSAVLYSQWEFIGLDSMNVRQIQIFGDTIWAGTAVYNNWPKISGLYRSTNKGKDWMQIDTALGDGGIGSLNIHPKNHNIIYLVKGIRSYSSVGRLFKSIDGGVNWDTIHLTNYDMNFGFGIKYARISSFDYNKIYALDYSGGVSHPIPIDINQIYKSSDAGNNWQKISPTFGSSVAFDFSIVKDSLLFALTEISFSQQDFYKSTDDGYSWYSVSHPSFVSQEIFADDKLDCRVYLASYFITDDCGSTWTSVNSPFSDSRYLSLYIDTAGSKLYLMETTGIYVSDKQTINWQKLSGTENLPLWPGYQQYDIGALKNVFLIGKAMYVGTLSGIYKKDDITDIENEQTFDSKDYYLSQNYPNPFNPSTMIEYRIPFVETLLQQVTLKIYDILGREVATLVNKHHQPGNHSVVFKTEGTDLSSGIYFYKLTAGSYQLTKKMLLLK
ncbi:MAG: T9SS type A sorting domain-containing protein [Ignavibacteriales bacterium]|nr:T9SS type A sorting domain-containing protein [Ignavibacteriales bacterium]